MSESMPLAVENLRKIWASKKIEMHFNQCEAATELGWSQGAISHYLNNVTPLGALAVVKLANFLDVDPADIDPAIVSKLPNVRKLHIDIRSDNMSKSSPAIVYSRDDIKSFYVELIGATAIENYPDIIINGPLTTQTTTQMRGYARLCVPEVYTGNSIVAVRLKKEKALRWYLKDDIPAPSRIHTMWAVISMHYQ